MSDLELATTEELLTELWARENVEFVGVIVTHNNCGEAPEMLISSQGMRPKRAGKMLQWGLDQLGV